MAAGCSEGHMSVSVDIGEFSDESFDALAWVRSALDSRPDEAALDTYVSELEMKLQLLAEEAESSFRDACTAAQHHIPHAAHDVQRAQGEVGGVAGQVAMLAKAMAADQSRAAAAVASLVTADVIKSQLQSSHDTLQEAMGLAKVLESVEEVMAGDNVAAMADAVARMRRSMHVVQNLRDFAGAVARLQHFERRLQSIAEPSLTDAINRRQGDLVQQYWKILEDVEQGSKAQKLYTSCGTSKLIALWDEMSEAQHAQHSTLAEWLPHVYDKVRGYMDEDCRWCSTVLPSHYPALQLQLLTSFHSKISKSCGDKLIAFALSQHVDGMLSMLALKDACTAYVGSTLSMMTRADEDDVLQFTSAAYAPFEAVIARYSELEASALRRQLADTMATFTTQQRDAEATTNAIASSLRAVQDMLLGAVQRCGALTCCAMLPGLLQVMDDIIVTYTSKIQAAVQILRNQWLGDDLEAAPAADQSTAQRVTHSASGGQDILDELADVDDSDDVRSLVQLVVLQSSFNSTLGVLEVAIRTAVNTQLSPLLDRVTNALAATSVSLDGTDMVGNGGTVDAGQITVCGLLATDLLGLYLQRVPQLVKTLRALEESMNGLRFVALPKSSARVAALQHSMQQLVHDVLMQPIRRSIEGMSEADVWTQRDGSGDGRLPTFSAYAGAAATAVGDYLMMLPQQLEGLVGADGSAAAAAAADDDMGLAAEWLDRIATAAAKEFADEVMKIPELTSAGAAQLAADIEFFVNVVAALGVRPSNTLRTLQHAVTVPPHEFHAQMMAGGDGVAFDAKAVAAVARMRGIAAPPT